MGSRVAGGRPYADACSCSDGLLLLLVVSVLVSVVVVVVGKVQWRD